MNLPLQLIQSGPLGESQILLGAAGSVPMLHQSVAESIGTDTIGVRDFLDWFRGRDHLPTQLVLEFLSEPLS